MIFEILSEQTQKLEKNQIYQFYLQWFLNNHFGLVFDIPTIY